MSLDTLNQKVYELYNEYKDEQQILNKLTNYITNELPNILINTKKQIKTRHDRKQLLQEAHDKFVNKFITQNIYFYCSTSEIFFKYNTEHYFVIKEDDIIHNILSTLNHRENEHQLEYFEEQLLPWKFKIKTSVIKQIRDIPLFNSIPESITIQSVLTIFMKLFNSKIETKYFLTIIGDIIHKKNTNINIISHNAKPLLRLLESIGSQYFGHIPLQASFRYKYHEHNYNDCRLLTLKEKPMLEIFECQKTIMNIFVVCAYYSNKHKLADDYLNSYEDNKLKERIFFLKNNDQDVIVNNFIDSKLQVSTNSTISMKNMLYLWKCYLEEINVPNIIFTNTLKTILKNKITYDETSDNFNNYTSISLPVVSNFIKFWDEIIIQDENEYYLEIEELCALFKIWSGKPLDIKEEVVINLIKHFYIDIVIEEKFIYGISCSLWNKKEDIILFLKYKLESGPISISTYDLYKEYSTEYSIEYNKKNNKKKSIIIGKMYFDIFINDQYKDYISDSMINIANR
jgi:ASC-1-like (ASCH) protein